MSTKRPEKIWGLVYNMMKSVNNDVPTILKTLDQVLSQKPTFDQRFDHDSIIPRSFVIWLFNQLLTFTARPLGNRVLKQNVQLQKKLLTFCCVHMPTLFETLLKEYNRTLSEFIEVCYNSSSRSDTDPRVVSTFISEDDQFFKEIDSKFVFEKISLDSDMVDLTMQCIIEVLTHGMSISFNVHRNLFQEILKTVLQLFLPSDTYTKLECLDFGVTFFDNLFELDQNLTMDYGILFEYCQLVWENLPNWIGFGFLDEYGLTQAIRTSIKLFKCDYRTCLTDKVDADVLESFSKLCEAILRTIIKDQDRLGNRIELKTKIIEFMLELHHRTGCLLPHQSFIQLIQAEHQMGKLFGAIQPGSTASSVLTRALEGTKDGHPIVKNILDTIIDMEHKSMNEKQCKIHLAGLNVKDLQQKRICSDIVFSCDNLQRSIEEFLRIMVSTVLSSTEFCEYIQICGLFLQSSSAIALISADLQIVLIDVILFYLRHHSKIKQILQLEIPGLGRIEDKPISVSLNALANVSHQNLDAKAATHFHKSVKEFICMMYPVCQSEPIKAQLNERLLDFVANSVISIKLIVCHMLPAIVKGQMNSQILGKIKCICCSALGIVYIFKTRSNIGKLEYKFLCADCEKPTNEDFIDYLKNKSAVLMQHQPVGNSFEETQLNFVINSIGGQTLFTNKSGIFAINHFSTSKLEQQVLSNPHLEPDIIKALLIRTSSNKEFPLLQKVGVLVLRKVYDSLERGDEEQLKVLHLISVLANIDGIPEIGLFHFFKMTFFYMICCESAVSNEAVKCATEMCANYGLDPVQLWLWYKRECLSLVVDLTTHIYLKKGQGLLRTLNALKYLNTFNSRIGCFGKSKKMNNSFSKKVCSQVYGLMNMATPDLSQAIELLDQILFQKKLFSKSFDYEGEIPGPFIVFLFNKLIFSFDHDLSNRIQKQKLILQKKLLSFCCQHKPILFDKLLGDYGESLKTLIKSTTGSQYDCRILNTFTCAEPMEIDEMFEFGKTNVQFKMIGPIMVGLIEVLTFAIDLVIQTHRALFGEVLQDLLLSYQTLDCETKIKTLGFGTRLFDSLFELDDTLSNAFVGLFEKCSQVWENLHDWITLGFLDEYSHLQLTSISLELFKCNYKNLINSLMDAEVLIKFSEAILFSLVKHKQRFGDKTELKSNILDFIIVLHENTGVDLSEQNLMQLLKSEQEVFKLFCIFSQSGDVSVVSQMLEAIENLLIKELQKSQTNYESLKLILNTIAITQKKSLSARQFKMYKSSKSPKEIIQLRSPNYVVLNSKHLKTAVSIFLRNKNIEELNLEEACKRIEIAGMLLGTGSPLDLSKLGLSVKKLIDMVFFYLRKCPSQSSLNREFLQESQLIESSLEAIANVAHHRLDSKSRSDFLFEISKLLARKQTDQIKVKLSDMVLYFLANGTINKKALVEYILPVLCRREEYGKEFDVDKLAKIKSICCCALSYVYIFEYRSENCNKYDFLCEVCENPDEKLFTHYFQEKSAVLMNHSVGPNIHESKLTFVLNELGSRNVFSHRNGIFAVNHFQPAKIENQLLMNSCLVPELIKALLIRTREENEFPMLPKVCETILGAIKESLEKDTLEQIKMLKLIEAVAFSGELPEPWVLNCFKMTFFFLISIERRTNVENEAMNCGLEICSRYKLRPIQLFNFYRNECVGLIAQLVVKVYLVTGRGILRSLNRLVTMLGFLCSQEFICKYYKILTAMILPYCVKEDRCKGLLVQLSQATDNSISHILTASFLNIYSHIYLYESPEIGNKCIDLLVRCTGSSLSRLMHTDVRQTVSEFLIFYNRKPEFVMQSFSCFLLLKSSRESQKNERRTQPATTEEFAVFIAERFLGVITYFETCLSDPNFEKSLKEDVLYSLGQIIRLVGAGHVTQSRYKIIAMLTSVISLNDKNLQAIGLKIWNTFLHIVDIQALGPSLSRIVVSLQPLLQTNEKEVDTIYKYLILENGNLLGTYMTDLYFIEDMEVSMELKSFVRRQTEALFRSGKFEDLLKFYIKQINNENLQVRIRALKYLKEFFIKHRADLNNFIVGQTELNPLIEAVAENLMNGCKHVDRTLQLISGKCLGELGAIDPSYMSPNYAKEQKRFSLSIHTDAFAITALTELCRAYQKNIKFVDNMSVAIQEILAIQGVNPKDNKKMNVWEAIPVRMRHIMEPLLSSCYTVAQKGYKIKVHPVFGSSFCRTYEDWAFWWSWKVIEFVRDADTKKLLCSFTPSIRKDNNMLELFLPYILLHSLQECTEEEMQLVYEEFQAVIQQAVNGGSNAANRAAIDTTLSKEIGPSQALRTALQQPKDIHLQNVDDACAKICFEQIDFLYRWTREWSRVSSTTGESSNTQKEYGMIQKLLSKIDKHQLAKANFNCGEYARALLFLELFIEDNKATRLQENLSFLIEIYAELLDPDSVEGAMHMKKTSLTLPEQILVNNIIDRPQENIACYEQIMIRPEQVQQEHVLGIINSYLRLDLPETVLNITSGLWEKLSERYTDDFFKECQFEPLLRLGCYDDIERMLEDPVISKNPMMWNVQSAKAIRLFRNKEIQLSDFQVEMDEIRLNILSTLKTIGAEHYSYHKAYTEILKLQLLTDIEKNKSLVQFVASETDEAKCIAAVNEFFSDWNARLCFLQPTVRILEPLLCLRRNLLSETKNLLNTMRGDVSVALNKCIDEEMGRLWIRSIQMNREAGGLQQANLSIMKAEEYAPEALFIEKAKLLWQSGDQTKSLKLISEKISEIESNGNIPTQDKSHRLLYSEAKFLQATYSAESMKICAEQNLFYFKQAIAGNKNSEKCLVHMAQYLEKMYAAKSDAEQSSESGKSMLYDIMGYYARAMKAGNDSMYQSMPRLLSIWFDFTSQVGENDVPSMSIQQTSAKMTELVSKCCEILPTYIFYSAFSQILSRICHPSLAVFEVLKTIIILLLEKYPHQSLWMLLPVLKSSYTMRAKRCRLILSDKRLSKRETVKYVDDFNSLSEKLIQLTTKDTVGLAQSDLNVQTLVPKLPKLFEDPGFSEILLPFDKYMQVTLLNANRSAQADDSVINPTLVNPFPNKQVYICGIKEDVVVLRSQALPKKIVFLCSDGKEYTAMLKPKDDLRLDYRLMEFNALLKRYLRLDPQARQRRLHIRTYAAIPFNEDCGLIEWLPNLTALRVILMGIYRSRKLGVADRELRLYVLPKEEKLEKKKQVFNVLLSRHPPVFHEWFIYQFSTPHNWYQARSSYIKTIAVMSMVGYILGLGDRHGENILFDETNGESVHVDFNCLFNKGESFNIPERVPFRLTQNMVHAMGPLGIEGLFRKCCEITLTVLQKQKKTLMSVLKPFVYDLSRLGKKTGNNIEKTDPQAMENVSRIEERLHGYVQRRGANRMPLSTEGQVEFLINEATDINNLAAMYAGWGPYL